MKPIITAAIILLGLLLIPPGQGSFSDTRDWHGFATSFTDTNGVVAATSFSLHSVPHSFTVTSRISLVEMSVAFTTTPASPAAIDDYSATFIIKEGATTRITCDGISFSRANIPDTGRLQFSFLSFCHGQGSNALNPGTTYTYETQVTMITGTNKIVNSGWSFKVEQTDTITDASLDGLATTADLTHVHNEIHNQASTTNARINNTFLSTINQINGVWARLNTTCQKTLISMVGCEGVEELVCSSGCNVTVNNDEVIEALGDAEMKFIGLTTEESWTLLALVALMIWALYNEWWWAFGAMLLGTIGVVLGLAEYNAALLVFLIILGFTLQLMVNKHKKRLEEAQQART